MKSKKDEYYTLYEDIEQELQYYTNELTGKTIYCNCDNPKYSQFIQYFIDNYKKLQLKELIASYRNLDGSGGVATYDGLDWICKELENGSYDSKELTEYLNRADVVVTNPPFSQLAYFLQFLLDRNKDFIVLGNLTAITIIGIFNAFKERKIFYGHHIDKGHLFLVSEENYTDRKTKLIDGKHYLDIGNIVWWTSFDGKNIKEKFKPTVNFKDHKYYKYFNYDAINVDKVKLIPKDYFEEMGVPITYTYKHNPDLFEIIGLSNKVPKTRKDVPDKPDNVWIEKDGKPWKCPFKRIIIRRRKNEK